jgi:hypothetical protein
LKAESPTGVPPTVVVQPGWPRRSLRCTELTSAIAFTGQEPAVQLAMQRPCTQLCASGVWAVVSVSGTGAFAGSKPALLRALRPLVSLREKKATGTLPSSGLGFSLPWRFTDTVAHPENLFCAHAPRHRKTKIKNQPHTHIFETHVSHIFRFFSLSCEH